MEVWVELLQGGDKIGNVKAPKEGRVQGKCGKANKLSKNVVFGTENAFALHDAFASEQHKFREFGLLGGKFNLQGKCIFRTNKRIFT